MNLSNIIKYIISKSTRKKIRRSADIHLISFFPKQVLIQYCGRCVETTVWSWYDSTNYNPSEYLPNWSADQSFSNKTLSLPRWDFLLPLNRSEPQTHFFNKKLRSNGLKLSFLVLSFRFNKLCDWTETKLSYYACLKVQTISHAKPKSLSIFRPLYCQTNKVLEITRNHVEGKHTSNEPLVASSTIKQL